jgi:hypothetical protein
VQSLNPRRDKKTAFRDAVLNSKQRDENGCMKYSNTGCSTLSLNQLNRGSDPEPLVKQALAAPDKQVVTDLFAEVFATRNARGGKGERTLSYQIWFALKKHYPLTAMQILPLFVHYGYWKDLLHICVMSKSEQYGGSNATSVDAATTCQDPAR